MDNLLLNHPHMQAKTAVLVIFIISIAGLLFSGYLSYYELFVPEGCSAAIVSCGTKNIEIANLPACVYGFFMYLVIFLVSGSSVLLKRSEKKEKES